MSAPGNGTGPPQPQLAQMAKIVCLKCKEEFIVRIPIPRIINALDFTTIIFVHENFDKCPNCGQVYAFNIPHITNEGQFGMTWIPLQTEQSALVPGTDGNLAQALKADEIAKKIKLQ